MPASQIHAIFLKFLQEQGIIIEKNLFLLAVSGGVDSMVMLELFHSSGARIVAAHVNYGLRSQESDLDERLVSETCSRLNVPLHIKRFNPREVASEAGSIQMAARELRYNWFRELATQTGAHWICTAHHAGDSLETFLNHLVRGSGIAGLTGIHPINDTVLRPLLCLDRSSIFAFAEARKLKWREDSSNASDKYRRNRIRNRIVPEMLEMNPSLFSTFRDTSLRLRGVQILVNDKLSSLSREILIPLHDGLGLEIEKLNRYQREVRCLIIENILAPYGFTFPLAIEVEKLMHSSVGSTIIHGEWIVLRDRDQLLISRSKKEQRSSYVQRGDGLIRFGDWEIKYKVDIKPANWKPSEVDRQLELDADQLSFPLVVRMWQKGDKWQPLGLSGKKKMSDFMIDRKIPLTFKSAVPMLVSDDEIVAVIGYGVSETAKVRADTNHILKLRYEKPF